VQEQRWPLELRQPPVQRWPQPEAATVTVLAGRPPAQISMVKMNPAKISMVKMNALSQALR
jgi:hypothetical protein